MIVLLPEKKDGLKKLEQSMTPDKLRQWIRGLFKKEIDVWFPKFELTAKFSLKTVLKSLGMTDAFAPGKADFSAMANGKDIFLSTVLHKAYVKVNEKGTEAAAATGGVIGITSIPEKPLKFRADHPFIFLIRDNQTKSILFMGRITNPKE